MKRTTNNAARTLVVLSISLFMALPAMAQHQEHHRMSTGASDTTATMGMQHGMMGGGMHGMHGGQQGMMGGAGMQGHMEAMQAMMSNPVYRPMMMVRLIPTMEDALDLTERQTSELHEMQKTFESKAEPLRSELSAVQNSLEELMGSRQAFDPEKVRSQAKKRATLSADLEILSYETASKMQGMLTPEQQDRLAAMQPAQLAGHMTSHMAQGEMMNVMRGAMMAGMSCPMMNGQMMSGGMMNGSMMNGPMHDRMPDSDSQ